MRMDCVSFLMSETGLCFGIIVSFLVIREYGFYTILSLTHYFDDIKLIILRRKEGIYNESKVK